MKLIPLSKNSKKNAGKYFAIVDDEDYDYLMQWNWCANCQHGIWYAIRSQYNPSTQKQNRVAMHRVVNKEENSKIFVDHINHDGLDNRSVNLRKCNHFQNARNKISAKGSSSKYLGVSIKNLKHTLKNGDVAIYQHWIAQIKEEGKNKHIGVFKTEELAAIAYK